MLELEALDSRHERLCARIMHKEKRERFVDFLDRFNAIYEKKLEQWLTQLEGKDHGRTTQKHA